MFITFEGIEGCGKSTQAAHLVDRLKAWGIPAVLTREPGGTRMGQDIRRILLDSRNQDISPLTELLLYAADRAQHVRQVIKPALTRNQWIVCDRYADATVVYQGYARGQDISLITLLNQKASLGLRPEITFLIDCPVAVGIARALRRNRALPEDGQDRFEKEHTAFHEAVRKGYLLTAEQEPERFIVLDGNVEESPLANRVWEHLSPFLTSENSGRKG